MSKLRSPLRDQLRDTTPDEVALNRMWSGIQKRSAGGSSPRLRWTLAVAAAACVLLLVGRLVRLPPDEGASGPLLLADHSPIGVLEQPAGAAAREIALADQSSLSVSGGALLEPLENTAERFDVLLRKGLIEFEVHPGGHRRWIIESGPATVEVVGTHFTVQRDDAGVDVVVTRGTVLVRGERVSGGVARLTAGMRLHVASEDKPLPVPAPTLVPAPSLPQPTVPPAVVPAAARPPSPKPLVRKTAEAAARPVAPPPPSWESLGQAHHYAEAYEALGAKGTAAVETEKLPIEAMMELADVARLSGHADEAVKLLAEIPVRFPDNRTSALAAFTRGRVELDQLKHPATAAEAFAQAIQLGLPGALAEDAGARLVEARHAAGDARGAESAYQTYVAAFPSGQDLPRLRALLGKQ